MLADPEVRAGIKAFSDWPTVPQLYVKGEFVGGSRHHDGDVPVGRARDDGGRKGRRPRRLRRLRDQPLSLAALWRDTLADVRALMPLALPVAAAFVLLPGGRDRPLRPAVAAHADHSIAPAAPAAGTTGPARTAVPAVRPASRRRARHRPRPAGADRAGRAGRRSSASRSTGGAGVARSVGEALPLRCGRGRWPVVALAARRGADRARAARADPAGRLHRRAAGAGGARWCSTVRGRSRRSNELGADRRQRLAGDRLHAACSSAGSSSSRRRSGLVGAGRSRCSGGGGGGRRRARALASASTGSSRRCSPWSTRSRSRRSTAALRRRPRQSHRASGGRLIRIASTLPPVLSPKVVPRS